MLKYNRKKQSPQQQYGPTSGKEIVHRPIFHHDLDTNSRVVHCTCRWVFQWHCKWGFPCQRRQGNRDLSIMGIPPRRYHGPKEYTKRKKGRRRLGGVHDPDSTNGIKTENKGTETNWEIQREDKATDTNMDAHTKNKKTNTNWSINLRNKSTSCESLQKVDKSTQFDTADERAHENKLVPSSQVKAVVEVLRSRQTEIELSRKEGETSMENINEGEEEEGEEENEEEDVESYTGESLPKPFHRMNTVGKTLKKSLGKVPELLKPGVRVIKAPSYDHEKFTAVLGDYIGTVICVEFTEEPQVWEYKKGRKTRIAILKGEKSKEDFEVNHKDELKGFRGDMKVTGIVNSFVEVQWDNGQSELCTIGPDKFELLVYNTNEIHENIMCNGCKEEPIIGTRWACVTCKFINLCTSCYMADKYNRNHIFQRIMIKGFEGQEMPSRSSSTDIGKRHEAYGVTKGSRVSFIAENMQGKVLMPRKDAVYRYKINNDIYPFQTMASVTKGFVLQGITVKEPTLPQLTSEMVRKLPEIRVMMKVNVKNSENGSKFIYIVGAILAYKESGHSNQVEARVQWDTEKNTALYTVPSKDSLNCCSLFLFDTGLKTETQCTRCNKNIKGITWKNRNNEPYCTICYMKNADKFIGKFTWRCGDELRGEFSRENVPDNSTDVLSFLENDVEYRKIESNKTCSVFCGSEKASMHSSHNNLKGKLVRDSFLHPMVVQSTSGLIILRDLCELKIEIGIEKNNDCHFYYQDHLHLLGEDETEFFEAKVKYPEKKKGQVSKILVHVWQKGVSVRREGSYRPLLHFIFVDEIEEIFHDVWNFLGHSRISCHLFNYKIMLWHNRRENSRSCGVHQETEKETIIMLLENGFKIFKVMKEESGNDNDQKKENAAKSKKKKKNGFFHTHKSPFNINTIKYFITMAERSFGEKVMPVILTSKEIDELDKRIQDKAREKEIPILSFQDFEYVSVSWSSKPCTKKDIKQQKGNRENIEEQCTEYCFPKIFCHKNSASISPERNNATDKRVDVKGEQKYEVDRSKPGASTENDKPIKEECEPEIDRTEPIALIVKDKKVKEENKYEVYRTKPWIIREWHKDQVLQTETDDQRFLLSQAIHKDFVFLVSSILVGVVIHKLNSLCRRERNDLKGKMLFYVRSLSCQLLKEGQWVFPGEYLSTLKTLDKIFAQISLEYIYEKNMKDEFNSGLWEDLKIATKSAYRPPKQTEDGQLILKKDCTGVDLAFFALLKKKKFVGGRQLIEKGCVGVRSILIGCKILNSHAEEWRTSDTEKMELEDMAKVFSQHALSIMNYIQEKDEMERQKSPKGWLNKVKNFLIKEDEMSSKTGRLLLNHGYLDVAYKTKNECFLENPKLKTMIKELWYGEDYQTKRKSDAILRMFLCIMHVFIMPIMLFTLDKPSWIYKKYHTPILKLWVNTVGLSSFLVAFAYMLLFDYKENGVSQSEFAVLFWIANKFVDESQQICVAVYRDSKRKTQKSLLKEYIKDIWNRLDLLIILTSFLGFIVKLLFNDDFLQGFAKIMFLTSYIMLNIRVLNMFWTSEFLGAKLVIIQKMLGITVAFMGIMIVIMMCYNVVDYALLYPNTEFTWTEIENIVRNGYWTLYGDFQEDVGNDCTNNATIYSQGIQQRCPTSLGAFLSPYLRAIYCLIAILMLLNLLVAIYTNTSDSVHEKSRMYWSQLQSNFVEEYTIRTIYPVHFKICCLGALAFHFLLYLIVTQILGEQHEGQARFIKVLVFDDNFDVNHDQETSEEMAEKNGMLEMQGEKESDVFEDDSTEQQVMSGQNIAEEKVVDPMHDKPSEEEIDKKIDTIIKELNEVKRLCASKDGP